MKSSSSSLAGRAIIALALMVGFYVTALVIAGVLAYIPYAEWVYGGRVHIKLALGCIGGAAVILWSIIPRIDRFMAPGPELQPDRHPEMFKTIREVAERTKQEHPAAVYIVPEMNAWVAQRGGIMGFGSHRVMGIGLPLLQVTTTTQFKAILAHEFGHYYSGDTSLGPWIYKTRAAIGRTLENLGDGSWLQKPFIWYGNMFLRVTHAVSRGQEFSADRLAARTYGADAAIGGLKAVYGHSGLFQSYWRNEVGPILNAGRKPPLAEGFQRFVAAPAMTKAVSLTLEEEMKQNETDPYQTHPSLPDRIAALSSMPVRKMPEGDKPAISLLHDVPAIETEILLHFGEQAKDLKPINWGNVGTDVYMPLWQEAVQKHAEVFKTVTALSVTDAATDLPSFSQKLIQKGDPVSDEKEREHAAAGVLGAALALSLHGQGWSMSVLPGEHVTLERQGITVQPFAAVRQLADGQMKKEDWQKKCAEGGFADVRLWQA